MNILKNTKSCPKCCATDIVIVKGTKTNQARGNVIFTGATIFSAAVLSRYVCCNCGFAEEWIDDSQDLQKIKLYHSNAN